MRRINNWIFVELTKPTIIGTIYGDHEIPDGYEVQVSIKDIDGLLISDSGKYLLGAPDKMWWNSKKIEWKL